MSLSNKELLDKTLFLKDSVPFISIDGKEYEVSNPEEVGENVDIGPGHDFILKYPLKTKCGSPFIHSTEQAEWPGGVDLIKQQRLKSIGAWGSLGHFSIPDSDKNEFEFRTVARLLPKEKKEPEVHCQACGYSIEDAQMHMDHHLCKNKDFFNKVESSEPHEKGKIIIEGVTEWTPVESQEELWEEMRGRLSYELSMYVSSDSLKEVSKVFKLTRLTP